MPTNPVIDIRGESAQIAKNLQALGMALKMAFMTPEQQALTDPEYMNALANFERVNLDRQKEANQQAKEQRDFDYKKAGDQGAQIVASEKLKKPLREQVGKIAQAATGGGEGLGAPGLTEPLEPLPESTATFRDIIYNPDISKDAALAAASVLLKDQEKETKIKELTKGFSAIDDLLTPDMAVGIPTAIKLIADGAPEAVYSQFLPTRVMEMQKTMEEMKTKKTAKEMDIAAVPWLQKYGYLPAGSYPDGYPNAAKMMYDAQENMKERAHDIRLKASDDLPSLLEGDALAIAARPEMAFVGPEKIATELKRKYAGNPNIKEGMIFGVATAAAKTMNGLNSSNSVDQSRSRLMYKMGVGPAVKIINELNAKGVYWTPNMDRILQQYKGSIWAGLGTSGAGLIASVRGGPTAGLGTRISADDRISDDFRNYYRKKLSPSETQLMNNVLTIMEAEMRELSGKRFETGELGREIQRRFIRDTEATNEGTKKQKTFYLEEIAAALRHKAGLPKETPEEMANWPTAEIEAGELVKQQVILDSVQSLMNQAGDDAKKALDLLRQATSAAVKNGMRPVPEREVVRDKLEQVLLIDQQIQFLSHSSSPEAKNAVKTLEEQRRAIMGRYRAKGTGAEF